MGEPSRRRRLATGLLGSAFPAVRAGWRAVRLRASRSPEHRRVRGYVAQHGLTVVAGPFAGLAYVREALYVAEGLVPKLAGSYERELAGVIERAIASEPPTVVNVGAADGYYAIGLARRLPEATVLAFDIDPSARRLCTRLARANRVAERVRVAGECDLAGLTDFVADRALVVMDCEGCEADLLVPERVPFLERCSVLVELHGILRPGSEDEVIGRFEQTHDVELIETEPRADPMLDERRPGPMRWAYFTPR